MARTAAEINAAVAAALAKGDVAGAQALLAEKPSDAPVSAVEAAAPPPPPVKRSVSEIELDLFKAMHSLLGNHDALRPLINELQDAVAPAAEAPKS